MMETIYITAPLTTPIPFTFNDVENPVHSAPVHSAPAHSTPAREIQFNESTTPYIEVSSATDDPNSRAIVRMRRRETPLKMIYLRCFITFTAIGIMVLGALFIANKKIIQNDISHIQHQFVKCHTLCKVNIYAYIVIWSLCAIVAGSVLYCAMIPLYRISRMAVYRNV